MLNLVRGIPAVASMVPRAIAAVALVARETLRFLAGLGLVLLGRLREIRFFVDVGLNSHGCLGGLGLFSATPYLPVGHERISS